MLFVILTVKEVLERFMKKNCYDYYNSFNSWFDKIKILLYKMNYFPKPYTRSKNKIKVELGLSNYVIKPYLKNATGIDTSKFADLPSLKSDIDKLDIDRFPLFLLIFINQVM